MSATNYLGLNIPDKNSKGRVVTEVFEPNFTKLDQNAEVVDRDKNAIWGGLDGGGLIEDPSVTKVVGKRYIGADGKAYICLVPSNINNSENYTPCNVVDNLNKIQNLDKNIMLIESPIRTAGVYNFLEEINLEYKFLNIVTSGMGAFRLRLSDYNLPFEFIVNGFSADTEYTATIIDKSNINVRYAVIEGTFQAEIKKIYLSNI